MGLIVYGTQYGTSKKYALELAQITGDKVIDSQQLVGEIEATHVILIGSLYAGRMMGLKKVLQKLTTGKHELTLITVGMTDPAAEMLEKMQQPIQKQVTDKKVQLRGCYHLQGTVDYQQLALKHKLVIKPMLLAFKKKGPEELDDQARALLQAFEGTQSIQKIDFTDLAQKIYS